MTQQDTCHQGPAPGPSGQSHFPQRRPHAAGPSGSHQEGPRCPWGLGLCPVETWACVQEGGDCVTQNLPRPSGQPGGLPGPGGTLISSFVYKVPNPRSRWGRDSRKGAEPEGPGQKSPRVWVDPWDFLLQSRSGAGDPPRDAREVFFLLPGGDRSPGPGPWVGQGESSRFILNSVSLSSGTRPPSGPGQGGWQGPSQPRGWVLFAFGDFFTSPIYEY